MCVCVCVCGCAQVRRALAHWIGRRLSLCFALWQLYTQEGVCEKRQLTASLVHWYRGTVRRAFTLWRDRAMYKVCVRCLSATHTHRDPNFLHVNPCVCLQGLCKEHVCVCVCVSQADRDARARAYLAIVNARTAAFAFFMLRANTRRKRRSRAARWHYLVCLRRRALMAWRERSFVARLWESKVTDVFKKVCVCECVCVCVCVHFCEFPRQPPCVLVSVPMRACVHVCV